ncbi:hypothetical protein V5074_05270 [Atlantibacter hermannii]|uniref:hypothetical protein n=1 Tax=Atlantibacter hermannii TaxID=565 RepID=UPI00307684F4
MKTQMQIIEDAIARIEGMSRAEFVDSLISSGLVEKEMAQHEVFCRVIKIEDVMEVVAVPSSLDMTEAHGLSGKELSFVF